MSLKCFFLEETTRRRRWLRRFTFGEKTKCSARSGGHDAMVILDDIQATADHEAIGDNWTHDDPRWPAACECGYKFEPTDQWQLFEGTLYRRIDTGEEYTLRDAPPGALWYCDWMLQEGSARFRGPDGHSLCARLPNGRDWQIDGGASNCTMPEDAEHRCWIRHGDPRQPETLTVDKNGYTCAAGAGSILSGEYHGFLRNGEFT